MSTELNDLFNFKIKGDVSTGSASREYRPNPRDAKGGKYTALIRFVPWVTDPSKSIMKKYETWIKNPATGKSRCVDNPRTVGDNDNMLSNTFFMCRDTGRQDFIDVAKKTFSTHIKYSSVVEIIQDSEHPEYAGKLFVFRFGSKIYDKIMAEQNPPYDNAVGINPFDPIKGRFFSLVITMVSGFPNYDQSSFIDYRGASGETAGLRWVNPKTGNLEIATESSMSIEENRNNFADWLKVYSPDLSVYEYKPWSEEDVKFIQDACDIVTNYVRQGFVSQQPASNPSVYNSPLNLSGFPVNPATSPVPNVGAPTPVQPKPVYSQPAPTQPQAPVITGIPSLPDVQPIGEQEYDEDGGVFGNLDEAVQNAIGNLN